MTERKRTEQLVRLLNRVLRHNLRNDMNALVGSGELLQEASDPDIVSLGERVERTAWSLVELSAKARDLERIARSERDPRRIDPRAILDRVVATHRDRHPGATVEVTVGTDRDIPAGPELETALSELVGNALKHNPSSDPWVGIEVSDDGAWVELVVADDGPGVGEMETAVIDSGEETALEHGSGMGLWLVNWIVTRYGGSFGIRANDGGVGSTATVRLPGVGPAESVADAERGPTVLFR